MRSIADAVHGCVSPWCPSNRRAPCPARRSNTGNRSCAAEYAELDEHVRGLLARLRDEPDLAARTAHFAALARSERRLAVLHPSIFPGAPITAEQAESLRWSALLVAAVTLASRAALGERLALPVWTRAPLSSAAPALREMATTTDPARRARALEAMVSRLRPHLGSTATECLAELAVIEDLHARSRCGTAVGTDPRR